MIYFQPTAIFITRFCDQLKSGGNSALIKSYLPDALNSLISMSTQYREDALSLVLETLSIVISVSKLAPFWLILKT